LAYGAKDETQALSTFPVLELFREGRARATVLLAVMMGLNFFAYQAFNGWLSTYLVDTRHLTYSVAGSILAWSFTANIVGCFFWGWTADRFGRRLNALGFAVCAAAIGIILSIGSDANFLLLMATLYGFALSCSVIWAPWIAELYPAQLRSTAASIYQWGRIISFFAPLLTGALAEKGGLSFSMSTASLAFLLAALIWIRLPETLADSKRDPIADSPDTKLAQP
jgi:MFS family permease